MATINVKLRNGQTVPMSHPDDWSQEQVEKAIHESFPEENAPEEGFAGGPRMFPRENQGDTGWNSLFADAIEKVGDIMHSTGKFAANLPEETKGAVKMAGDKPGRFWGQLANGLLSAGKGRLNAPHDINSYLASKELTPFENVNNLYKDYAAEIPSIPENTGLEEKLGLDKEESGDKLLKALPSIVAGGAILKSLSPSISKVFKAPDLKQSIRETQSKVNLADEKLAKSFDKVEEEVEKRGIGRIPVSKDIIINAKKFLDKSPESMDLIKRAKTGDYKALRELQADLRKIGETALSNKLTTERKVGREALSTRKQINDSIQNHFEETGHKDLAEQLEETKQGYSDLQKTYFSTPALAKVFGKSQRVPKNPKTLLTEESTEMNRFMSAHPEVKEALSKALKHEGRMKAVKWLSGILGIGTTAEFVRELRRK